MLLNPTDGPIAIPTAVNLDSVESVSTAVLVERRRVPYLSADRMREICAALEVAVDSARW